MKYPEYKYIITALGSIKYKRQVSVLDRICLPDSITDCFQSWCRYDKSLLKYHRNKNGSVAGFDGKCYSDYIPIDIDSTSLDIALNNVRNILTSLVSNHQVSAKVLNFYFSGKKGFHVEIPIELFGNVSPGIQYHYIVKQVINKLGLQGVDPSMYQPVRLYRINNTIHSKSNKYKIQLSFQELMSLEVNEILKLADNPRSIDRTSPSKKLAPKEKLQCLWRVAEKEINQIYSMEEFSKQNSYSGVNKNHRNNSAYYISSQYHKANIPIDTTKKYIIEKWNPTNLPPVKDIGSLVRTVHSAYSNSKSRLNKYSSIRNLNFDPFYSMLKNNDRKVIYIDLLMNLGQIDLPEWRRFPCASNQLITSARNIASRTNTTESKVRSYLAKLQSMDRITLESMKIGLLNLCTRITLDPAKTEHELTNGFPSILEKN